MYPALTPKSLSMRPLKTLILLISIQLATTTAAAATTTTTTTTTSGAQTNPAHEVPQQRPNEIVAVDLQSRQNVDRHHTSKYLDLNPHGRQLVLRRGELFDVLLKLSQPYNRTSDKIRLEFSLGEQPQLADKSLNYVPLLADHNHSSFAADPFDWDARIVFPTTTPTSSQTLAGRQIRAQIHIPANASIGGWQFRISTKLANSKQLQTFSIRDTQIYIIFNPWNANDDVYLGREDARSEYILNEVGKIYIGSYSTPVGRKWTYGQFEQPVLAAVMHMLDRLKLNTYERANVVQVARSVSAMVNSHDDGGFLVGNWSGNYGDGLAPWHWTGSAAVFRKFAQNGYRSVKFGQCWVFGGVTTTTLRTLGIPARTISNFVSAHDTDSSLTVDKFYTDYGHEMSGINGDSIWNFHVWSDAWMARPDLPAGFGGWQAIDATPQEQSGGKYQLGPAPLEAIKRGKTSFAYDVAFVYSEVNADLVYWHRDGRSKLLWRRTRVQGGHVGRKILTKQIGLLDERSRSGANDAEDIVLQYKFPEGSMEARQARSEAAKLAGLLPLFSDTR